MRPILPTFLAISVLALAARADDTWTQTFSPAAVASYVDAKTSFLVASAGPESPKLAGASQAFEAALRAGGKADLVMNAQAIGKVNDLEDAKIVEKAAALPVALVAVVRVFEDPSGPASVVVTTYEKGGKLKFALSGKEGTAIAPNAAASGPALQGAVAKTVAEAALTAGGADTPAQKEYDEKFVFFEDYATIGMNQYGAVVSRTQWSQAFQGKYRKPLEGAGFYDAIGHPELAQKFRDGESRNTRWILVGTGTSVATFAFGTYLLFAGREDGSHIGAALGFMLGGPLVGMGVCFAGYSDPNPVDAPTARRLVDEYDTDLKKRLNLSAIPLPGGAAVAANVAF